MKVLESRFAKEFIKLANLGSGSGWHERNGGNLSYRLTAEEAYMVKSDFMTGTWRPIGVDVTGLAGDYLMITAAGSYFRDIAHKPKELIGIIEVDRLGKSYRTCWGFEADHMPTSELASHLLNHEIKKAAGMSECAVIYHAHPVNLIALTFVLPLDGVSFTRALWGMISECAMVFPQGIGVLDWMVPGSLELGYASARLMANCNAVVWAHHGLICAGKDFSETFGLVETIEKAAEVLVKVKSMQPGDFQMIGDGCLRQMSEAYHIDLPDMYFIPDKASLEETLYPTLEPEYRFFPPDDAALGTSPLPHV